MKDTSFEETFRDTKSAIEVNSIYKKTEITNRTTMSAVELGKLLGLKKTERYWLLHKHYFEWEEINGSFRINIESFEKWYANQIKYKKVNGEEPGTELKEWSYSPAEIAQLLNIDKTVVYEIIKKNNIRTVLIDHWKRVPKEDFYHWYKRQSKYQTEEDRKKNSSIIEATITMPEMARLLGVTREQIYSILKHPLYKEVIEIIRVADRKRITKESFRRFLESQDVYHLSKGIIYKEASLEESIAVADYHRNKAVINTSQKNNRSPEFYTVQEAAQKANVSRSLVYHWAYQNYFSIIQVMSITRIPRMEFEKFLEHKTQKLEE